MKKNGCAVAVAMLLLIPGCKTDRTPSPSQKAPAKDKENLANTQSEVEPSAREAADKFLKALKIIDSPEGRKTLAESRWRQTMKFPEYKDIATLSEEMFSTDIPGVRGYKRVARLVIPREGGRPFVKRYMLIAYKDTKKRTWKVFDFTDVADPEREAGRACGEKALQGGEATTPQGCRIQCSYWLLMAGKVKRAEEMAKKANELYAKNSDPDDEARYYKTRADATLKMISRITSAQI